MSPRIVEEFPRRVRDVENVWIPMSDGCRLAARIWLPEDAATRPVPAIVEYIPYRKRDGTRLRDEPMHRYFAGHGYAGVRIDLRGSGESDGVLLDEYLEQEQQDGVEAIRWVAAQPWCSGEVGMMGKSWGGFNSLQVAARRPPELKAILSACSTDDRYADDAHYMGGCLLNENLVWGSLLFTLNAQPPDPQLVGGRWREMWLARLRENRLFPAVWLRHQRRDAYWRHGSVCEDFGSIACPVYAVGGWADGYTNAVPRLLAGLGERCKGLVGPWAHVYPHEGVPGPAIGFLQEALRWWDRWLKGVDTGIDAEPRYRVWMQESAPPRSFHVERPGRWVAERAWPSPRIRPLRFGLAPGRLLEPGAGAADAPPLEHRSPQTVGLAAGSWCGFGIEGESPADQREDDARSLCFDSDPLPRRVEVLGAPVVRLAIESDRPQGLVAVRLCELLPGGGSARVTFGLLNLAHRASHERPTPLVPGREHEIVVRLNDVAHAFPAGARLRLALSTSYWPMAWPSPAPVRLRVLPGRSWLELPERPPDPADAALPEFEPPETAPPPESTDVHEGGVVRRVERDPESGETTLTVSLDAEESGPSLTRLDEIGLEVGHSIVESFRIRDDDPLSARADIRHETLTRRAGWSTSVRARTRLSSTAEHFLLEAELEAFEDGERVVERTWSRSIPRDLV